MKNILRCFGLVVLISVVPYFVGVLQYQNAIAVVQNMTEQTDVDISDAMLVFNFDTTNLIERPGVIETWVAGYRCINTVVFYYQ